MARGRRWGPVAAAAAMMSVALAVLLLGALPAMSRRGALAAVKAVPSPLDVEVVQTNSDLSQRMAHLPDLLLAPVPAGGLGHVIKIDDGFRFQRIAGVGGAMTDSSAWLIERKLRPAATRSLIEALFGTGGIHLSFMRVPIGASDFTHNGRPYSYDDVPAGATDPLLRHFSIAHDEAYVIPALRQALAANPSLELLANTWSPPAWMKTNDRLDNIAHSGELLPDAYKPFAAYLVKFLEAYRKQGVPITAITPQNEPTQDTGYPGLEFPEPDEAYFITRFLAPALRTARLHTALYGSDFGWSLPSAPYAFALASGPAGRDLTGIAWHCYFGDPNVMSRMHARSPALEEIMDECSTGLTPNPVSEVMLGSIRNWASAVVLWNLALDPSGGPVQPPNGGCHGCTGIVTINPRTHAVSLGLSYYQLGQLSAFVQPGAVRVYSNHFVTYRFKLGEDFASPGLDDAAFVNPDGSRVLVAYANTLTPQRFTVEWDGRGFTYTLAPGAMATFIWSRP